MKANRESVKFRLPRDSVTVHIPITVTVDMGVVMRHVRSKRVSQLRSLLAPTEADTAETDAKDEEDVDMDTSGRSECKERPKPETVPRREQYSSMLDYLEAKYVKGVMLEENNGDHVLKSKGERGIVIMSDSEESGSCYSEESGNFIDDSDLKTDIIQQVFASSTFVKTKLEAQGKRATKADETRTDGIIEDDDAYFVNIGNLEMEDGWDDRILLHRDDGTKRVMCPG
jgi:hypothetical protein